MFSYVYISVIILAKFFKYQFVSINLRSINLSIYVPYNVVEDIMLSPIDRDMEKAFQTS